MWAPAKGNRSVSHDLTHTDTHTHTRILLPGRADFYFWPMDLKSFQHRSCATILYLDSISIFRLGLIQLFSPHFHRLHVCLILLETTVRSDSFTSALLCLALSLCHPGCCLLLCCHWNIVFIFFYILTYFSYKILMDSCILFQVSSFPHSCG